MKGGEKNNEKKFAAVNAVLEVTKNAFGEILQNVAIKSSGGVPVDEVVEKTAALNDTTAAKFRSRNAGHKDPVPVESTSKFQDFVKANPKHMARLFIKKYLEEDKKALKSSNSVIDEKDFKNKIQEFILNKVQSTDKGNLEQYFQSEAFNTVVNRYSNKNAGYADSILESLAGFFNKLQRGYQSFVNGINKDALLNKASAEVLNESGVKKFEAQKPEVAAENKKDEQHGVVPAPEEAVKSQPTTAPSVVGSQASTINKSGSEQRQKSARAALQEPLMPQTERLNRKAGSYHEATAALRKKFAGNSHNHQEEPETSYAKTEDQRRQEAAGKVRKR